jgi:hypothetical protein
LDDERIQRNTSGVPIGTSIRALNVFDTAWAVQQRNFYADDQASQKIMDHWKKAADPILIGVLRI